MENSTMTAVGSFLSDAGNAVMNTVSDVGSAIGSAAESVVKATLPRNSGEMVLAVACPPVYAIAKVAEAVFAEEAKKGRQPAPSVSQKTMTLDKKVA